MTIGTSLGLVFKNMFQQQAGVSAQDESGSSERTPSASDAISSIRRTSPTPAIPAPPAPPPIPETTQESPRDIGGRLIRQEGEGSGDYALRVIEDLLREQENSRPGSFVRQRPAQETPVPSANDLQNRWDQEDMSYNKRKIDEISRSPSVGKNNGVELRMLPGGYRTHKYGFVNEDGSVGELSISPSQSGKQLYVNWIGSLGKNQQFDFGTKFIRNVIPILKKRYPDAETIAGLRVSGARMNSGSGSAHAEMRIRPRPVPAPDLVNPNQNLSLPPELSLDPEANEERPQHILEPPGNGPEFSK